MNAVLILVFCSAATLAQNAPGFTYITYITLVTLTLFVVTRLSCLCHQQERHAPFPYYLTTERITLFPRMASSVAVVYLAPGTASCLQWTPDSGTWEAAVTLNIRRAAHVSWTPSGGNTGTYLMGGYYSESMRTTTLITNDGSQDQGFPLKYDAQ